MKLAVQTNMGLLIPIKNILLKQRFGLLSIPNVTVNFVHISRIETGWISFAKIVISISLRIRVKNIYIENSAQKIEIFAKNLNPGQIQLPGIFL